MKLKVMTIVGTRPEVIKLSRVIQELDKYFDHTLVHTGQNYDYELNEVFFEDLELRRPDIFLEAAGSSSAETIANVIKNTDEALAKIKPDALLLYGDTNSCLSVLPAKRRHIPVFHMEAGNRCFDQRVPEELNRKVVDHLSDINMVHSEHARQYLLAEGIRGETIIKTGSPLREVLNCHREKIESSKILEKLKLKEKGYFIVSTHREENVDSSQNFVNILESLNALVEVFDKEVIVSTHPRTQKRLSAFGDDKMSPRVKFIKPLGFHDYNHLQFKAFCAISDSGTITEEANLLGFSAITIRNTHERPEGMDVGAIVMSGVKSHEVIQAVDIVTKQADYFKVEDIRDYQNEGVSSQVVRVIQSYTGYINRTVWKK